MIVTKYIKPAKFWLAVCGMLLLPCGSAATAGILFSYDASTGQLPTEQGWSAYEVDTDGPLTASNTQGSIAANANVAMETFAGDGLGILHLRDTIGGAGNELADLPNYIYQWTAQQKQSLINNGLKLTMVFRGQTTNSGGKGNIRLDLAGTAFEAFDNIDPNRAIQVQGLSAELVRSDEVLHTLVITGEKSGANDYVFNATFDGNALASPVFGNIVSPNVALANSVYFGASSSPNRGTDIFVRSVVVETLNVPEPGTAVLAALVAAAMMSKRKRT